ncbi:MAG: MarR family winged helix-turn-helix transcriptional regulator [Acutalibacteraceae bacterium]|nr:MarR family transcriptional regulator [Oscillospiraceae bacterium]
MDSKDIGYLFKAINEKMRMRFDNQLKKNDLTFSQSQVLFFININGGRVTQKQIEGFLEVSHPTVVGLIARLEKKGYLSCHTDKNDKRNKIVCQTQKAADFSGEMCRSRELGEAEMLNGLTDAERAELRRYLETIYNNMKK